MQGGAFKAIHLYSFGKDCNPHFWFLLHVLACRGTYFTNKFVFSFNFPSSSPYALCGILNRKFETTLQSCQFINT